MKVNEFDYHLPQKLIAQTPLKNRSASRLLILDKLTGMIEHKQFIDVIDYLKPGDVLVINNTKVIPARLLGEKEDTKAVIELLLIMEKEKNIWQCMVKPFRKIKIGTVIIFGNKLRAVCIKKEEEGLALFEFFFQGDFEKVLNKLGTMPLPPYITEKLQKQNRYQTVYAEKAGSIAAPTAGLHFTAEILQKLKDKGVIVEKITLHVGIGTFRPIMVDNVIDHKMHAEFFSISDETAIILNKAKQEKRAIVGVGTTTTRALESNYKKYNKFYGESRYTDIFIYPGYRFSAIDALITNFHLPKSTLIMLVSAFANKDLIMKAYEEAVSHEYRFFSFGDAMLIK